MVLFGLFSDEDYLRFAPVAPSDSPVSSHLHEDTGLGPPHAKDLHSDCTRPTYTVWQSHFHLKPNPKGEKKGHFFFYLLYETYFNTRIAFLKIISVSF